MTYRVFDDYRELREFIQAGKAKITIKSKKTGQHFTYQIQASRDGRWFVRTLTSGEDPWLYLGTIWSNRRFGFTKASPHNVREHPLTRPSIGCGPKNSATSFASMTA